MQSFLIALLIGVLLVSVVALSVLAWCRRRRISHLARHAHALGLRFASTDPFAVAQRYARFDLIASGHGARASNVTYGRLHGWSVRAFDFHYELGHGTQRTTRQWGVLVAQSDRALPEGLFWHEQDLEEIPLSGRRCRRRRGCWHCDADAHSAGTLARALAPLAGDRVSFQTAGSALLVYVPGKARRVDYSPALDRLGEVLDRLDNLIVPPPGPQLPPDESLQSGPERDTRQQ